VNPFRLAHRIGVRVEIADLGAWSRAELHAEYDPRGPVIRINARALKTRHGRERRVFVTTAVAHEIYHHLEAIGAVSSADRRQDRESAAEAFARSMLR
jgi:hypothetical protein